MEWNVVFAFTFAAIICAAAGLNFLNLADVECGNSFMTRKSRIINGTEAQEGEFPWIVSLNYHSKHHCGGALISSEWVVSAAHCFKDKSTKDISVTVGEINLKASSSLEAQRSIGVSHLILHPDFLRAPLHDIALIKVNSSVVWGRHVRPACLASFSEENFEGKIASVAGWGLMKEPRDERVLAKTLRKVEVPLLTNEVCQSFFDEARIQRKIQNPVNISKSVLCAGYKMGGKDACQGDSGSSLQVSDKNRQVVVGIVSTGIGCARPLLPGLYTRVAHYVSWIASTISEK